MKKNTTQNLKIENKITCILSQLKTWSYSSVKECTLAQGLVIGKKGFYRVSISCLRQFIQMQKLILVVGIMMCFLSQLSITQVNSFSANSPVLAVLNQEEKQLKQGIVLEGVMKGNEKATFTIDLEAWQSGKVSEKKIKNSMKEIAPSTWEFVKIKVALTQEMLAQLIQNSRQIADNLYAEAKKLALKQSPEDLKEAIKKYENAADLYQNIGEKNPAARAYFRIGLLYMRLSQSSNASDYFEKSIKLFKEAENKEELPISINIIGQILFDSGNKVDAMARFQEALRIAQSYGNKKVECDSYNHIGLLLLSESNYPEAQSYFEKALQSVQSIDDEGRRCRTLNNMGLVLLSLDKNEDALKLFQKILPLQISLGDKVGEVTTLGNIAAVQFELGYLREAKDSFLKVFELKKTQGDLVGQFQMLSNVITVYKELGETQKALETTKELFPIQEQIGDPSKKAFILLQIGQIYLKRNEPGKAMEYLANTLQVFNEMKDLLGQAQSSNSLGNLLLLLGSHQKAVTYFESALKIYREIKNKQGEAGVLNNLGRVNQKSGNYLLAKEYFEQALTIHRDINNRSGQATVLHNLGTIFEDLNEYTNALNSYNDALLIRRGIDEKIGIANTLLNIGKYYSKIKEDEKGGDCFREAISFYRAVDSKLGEAVCLSSWGRLKRQKGNLEEAFTDYKEALGIFEKLRGEIGSLEYRDSFFFFTYRILFEDYIELLTQLEKKYRDKVYEKMAIEISEQSRARTFLELLVVNTKITNYGMDPKLLENWEETKQRISEKRSQLIQLKGGKHIPQQILELENEIQEAHILLNQLSTEIRNKYPAFSDLFQPKTLTLGEIQQQTLDNETALISYKLGAERSYVWAITSTEVFSQELPSEHEIEKKTREVYSSMIFRQKESEYVKEGSASAYRRMEQAIFKKKLAKQDEIFSNAVTELSAMVLYPILPHLESKKRVLIVGDGLLQYIPFAMLPVPHSEKSETSLIQGKKDISLSLPAPYKNGLRPLIWDHEVQYIPSASTLALQREQLKNRKPVSKKLAILAHPVFSKADPVFSENDATKKRNQPSDKPSPKIQTKIAATRDEWAQTEFDHLMKEVQQTGITNKDGTFKPLPATGKLADDLEDTFFRKQSNLFQPALRFDANLKTATDEKLGEYQIVHFATHGVLSPFDPNNSCLVFSLIDRQGNEQDGFLKAIDTFNLKLPAELVVLHGCQTGLPTDLEKITEDQAIKQQYQKARSEGITGFTRGFMYAGAKRVMVSLWGVGQNSSSDLMKRFYKKLLDPKHPLAPAAALRAAQLEMLQQPKPAKKDQESQTHPYYWAGFVIHGDW